MAVSPVELWLINLYDEGGDETTNEFILQGTYAELETHIRQNYKVFDEDDEDEEEETDEEIKIYAVGPNEYHAELSRHKILEIHKFPPSKYSLKSDCGGAPRSGGGRKRRVTRARKSNYKK